MRILDPVGYSNQRIFFEVVWRMSAFPLEGWNETLARLSAAIAADAKALGVPCEMSPERVTFAYRHHRELAQTRAEALRQWRARNAARTDLTVEQVLLLCDPPPRPARRRRAWDR